ncbi:MAG: hypothetical protein QM736_18760 [Vicinamibacterales bacterium]
MTDEHDDVQSTEPLSALFMEPPLNDDGFTAAVMGPLDRNRRTRRIALGTGCDRCRARGADRGTDGGHVMDSRQCAAVRRGHDVDRGVRRRMDRDVALARTSVRCRA